MFLHKNISGVKRLFFYKKTFFQKTFSGLERLINSKKNIFQCGEIGVFKNSFSSVKTLSFHKKISHVGIE